MKDGVDLKELVDRVLSGEEIRLVGRIKETYIPQNIAKIMGKHGRCDVFIGHDKRNRVTIIKLMRGGRR